MSHNRNHRSLRTSTLLIIACSAALLPANPTSAQCDPQEVAQLVAPDGMAGDHFGTEVAIDDDIAIIGAPGDDEQGTDTGAAHILYYVKNGKWIHTAKLAPTALTPGDAFGTSVAISGHYAIVGAPFNDDFGTRSGTAYIFERNDLNEWIEIAQINALDAAPESQFGSSVAISGKRAIIGAPAAWTNGLPNAGAANLFEKNGNGQWTQVAKFIDPNASSFDAFGRSVSIAGNVAVVGADQFVHGNGAAFIYRRHPDGRWVSEDKITANDGEYGDRFGYSVAVAGQTVVVGAVQAEGGAAYVFRQRGNGHWTQAAKLMPPDGEADGLMGHSVSISGQFIGVGAMGFDDHRGAVYIFQNQGNHNWIEIAKLTVPDGARDDRFGIVSLSKQTVLVGTPRDDDLGENSGSAYIFDLNCNPNLTLTGTCPGPMQFNVENATPNERVAYLYARGTGNIRIPNGHPCAGTTLGLDNTAKLAAVVRTNRDGTANLDVNVPDPACGRIHVQALDITTCSSSNVVLIR